MSLVKQPWSHSLASSPTSVRFAQVVSARSPSAINVSLPML